jgi:hypothetical protein
LVEIQRGFALGESCGQWEKATGAANAQFIGTISEVRILLVASPYELSGIVLRRRGSKTLIERWFFVRLSLTFM